MTPRPNVLLILTDQQHYPPAYESDELAEFRREHLPGRGAAAPERGVVPPSLSDVGGVRAEPRVAADRPVPLAARRHADRTESPSTTTATTCSGWRRTPCRRWATGSGPAAIGRTTRASGTSRTRTSTPTTATGTCCRSTTTARRSRTTSSSTSRPTCSTTTASRSGSAPSRTGSASTTPALLKDPFTADETIALLKRLDAEADDTPWLTVCSFLNPHDDSLFGAIALTQGLRYHPSQVPHVDQAPTRDEDLSTKPSCQQSYVDNWSSIIAPQPWNELHLKFYYQMQAEVGRQITRVLDALRDTEAYENTIVIFCLRSRRHAGRPRRDAREVARRLRGGAARAVHRLQPTAARRRPRARHPDQPRRPDPDAARLRRHRPRPGAHPLAVRPHRRPPARRARPLAGDPRRRTGRAHRADPLHHRR